MSLIVNLIIIVAIIAIAGVIIYRTFKKVKTGGKCAACDYSCPLKKLKDEHDRQAM